MDDKKRMKDIAEIAGVSPGTVSNALNNKKGVSEETRNRVIKIAASMGYQKTGVAINSRIIRLIIVNSLRESVELYSDFIFQVIDGINIRSRELGYEVLVTRVKLDDLNECLNSPTNADGSIVLASELVTQDFEKITCLSSHPVVMLDNCCPEAPFEMVSSNNEGGFYIATRHLIENGHKKIGLLWHKTVFQNFLNREVGYHRALKLYGLDYDPRYKFELSYTFNECCRDMAEILKKTDVKSQEFPTAFAAVTDVAAVSAMKAFAEVGVKVPEDVSIVGFDNTSYCEVSTPPLTSINNGFKNLAMIAAERLVDKIEQKNTSRFITIVSGELISRESVRKIK